jgi:hypothetical protein
VSSAPFPPHVRDVPPTRWKCSQETPLPTIHARCRCAGRQSSEGEIDTGVTLIHHAVLWLTTAGWSGTRPARQCNSRPCRRVRPDRDQGHV